MRKTLNANFRMIERCIQSSLNQQQLECCAFMIENRIIPGPVVSHYQRILSNALFNKILIRQCELLFQYSDAE